MGRYRLREAVDMVSLDTNHEARKCPAAGRLSVLTTWRALKQILTNILRGHLDAGQDLSQRLAPISSEVKVGTWEWSYSSLV